MHNAEYVLENEMLKLLWDFGIQADHLISARRQDIEIINKNKKLKKKPVELWTLPFLMTTE